MKELLVKPKFMNDINRKGNHLVIEILIFIALFIVSSIITSIPLGIMQVMYYVQNPEVMVEVQHAALSGDTAKITEFLPTSMNLLSLICTVFMTISVFIYCRFIEKRKLTTLGFVKKKAVKSYLLGFLFGAVMISVPTFFCIITGSATFEGTLPKFDFLMLALFLFGFILQGMSEEVLCRGYFMVSIAIRYKIIIAIIVNSAVFALLHIFNPGISVLAMINLFLFGIFASVYVIKTGNIWGICAFHSSWNFFQGNFWGIKVSGQDMGPTLFQVALDDSKSFLSGGAFGLEGGLMVTIVLVIGTALLFLIKNKDTEKSTNNQKYLI